jgi:hypothetical protein
MNLLQRLNLNGQISSEELSKLSAIRVGVINSMECGQLRTMEFIRKTFEDCTSEEVEKIAVMVDTVKLAIAKEVAKEHGVDTWIALEDMMDYSMVKNAVGEEVPEWARKLLSSTAKQSPLERMGQTIKGLPGGKYVGPAAIAATLATLGLSLLHSAGQGAGMVGSPISGVISKIKLKKESQRILSEIIEENPELAKDEKIIEYFAALQKFAPHTVAANKPLAESMLKKMHQWGQIDPQTMGQLVEMEGSYLQNLSGGKGKSKGEGFRPIGVADWAALHAGVPTT